MTFTPKTWQDGATANGRLNAAAMIDLETRVTAYSDGQRQEGHTFIIPGTIAVASGATNYIPPIFVTVPSGMTVKLSKCRYIIRAGTSVTFKLQKNGSDITGFTGMSATTTAASTTPTAVTLADDDRIAVVVTAISAAPDSLSVKLVLDYS